MIVKALLYFWCYVSTSIDPSINSAIYDWHLAHAQFTSPRHHLEKPSPISNDFVVIELPPKSLKNRGESLKSMATKTLNVSRNWLYIHLGIAKTFVSHSQVRIFDAWDKYNVLLIRLQTERIIQQLNRLSKQFDRTLKTASDPYWDYYATFDRQRIALTDATPWSDCVNYAAGFENALANDYRIQLVRFTTIKITKLPYEQLYSHGKWISNQFVDASKLLFKQTGVANLLELTVPTLPMDQREYINVNGTVNSLQNIASEFLTWGENLATSIAREATDLAQKFTKPAESKAKPDKCWVVN